MNPAQAWRDVETAMATASTPVSGVARRGFPSERPVQGVVL